MIDGCSRLGTLFRVLVPVMTPGTIAAFIFNFVNCWNELFLSVALMNTNANRTASSALNGFIATFNIDCGSMSAAAVLTILPTMVMFALASRWIVQGLTAGAVKEQRPPAPARPFRSQKWLHPTCGWSHFRDRNQPGTAQVRRDFGDTE